MIIIIIYYYYIILLYIIIIYYYYILLLYIIIITAMSHIITCRESTRRPYMRPQISVVVVMLSSVSNKSNKRRNKLTYFPRGESQMWTPQIPVSHENNENNSSVLNSLNGNIIYHILLETSNDYIFLLSYSISHIT